MPQRSCGAVSSVGNVEGESDASERSRSFIAPVRAAANCCSVKREPKDENDDHNEHRREQRALGPVVIKACVHRPCASSSDDGKPPDYNQPFCEGQLASTGLVASLFLAHVKNSILVAMVAQRKGGKDYTTSGDYLFTCS